MKGGLAIHGGDPARARPWPGWPQWDENERAGLLAVLERGEWGGYDAAVDEFERAFAARHAARFCVTTVNGTTTLETALRALCIGPGDEVIVPPYTFVATAAAVRTVGATPALPMWNWRRGISPCLPWRRQSAHARKRLFRSTSAACRSISTGLLPLAERNGLAVIEDAAHAHGSSWNGQPVGALGAAGSFSFQASKNLTAGEGGALLTNDADLAEQLWSIANCGRRRDGEGYEHPNLGTNLRLSGWQAAVLSAGLSRLDDQLQRRMINARRLRGFLAEIDGLTPQRWDPRADAHAHHLFLMRYDAERFGGLSRQKFITALRAENIPASSLYAYPLYRQPPLFEPFSRVTPCPNSEMLCEQTISLSQNLLLAEPDEMDDIANAILKVRENIDALA